MTNWYAPIFAYFDTGLTNAYTEALNGLVKVINRTCTLHLSQENIDKNKFKPCLEYHIKTCAAPCVGYGTEKHREAIKKYGLTIHHRTSIRPLRAYV
jgi:excinuclease UvrABC nuclease subunit